MAGLPGKPPRLVALNSLRAKRASAISLLDDLAQSIFFDMFGDPAGNSKGLPMVQLKNLTTVGSGSTPSRRRADYYGGTIPWVKTTEVRGERILDTEEKITESGRIASRCRLHPAGSLVIALYGQGRTRGQCAILGIAAATNQACAVIAPNFSRYSTGFMFKQLQISYDRLRAMARGGNQANLNLGLIGDFEVLAPPLSDQENYSRRIAVLDEVKVSHLSHLTELDALFVSLQHRAFRGELWDSPAA